MSASPRDWLDLVRNAPYNHAIRRLDLTHIEDPERWATTWRAYLRKQSAVAR